MLFIPGAKINTSTGTKATKWQSKHQEGTNKILMVAFIDGRFFFRENQKIGESRNLENKLNYCIERRKKLTRAKKYH